jgi:hypothetical protein
LEGFEGLESEPTAPIPADNQVDVQQPRFTAPDFDPSSLPPQLQEQYVAMKNQFEELSSHIPNPETLENLSIRAQAFDRVSSSEEWKRFLDQEYPGDGGQRSSSEQNVLEQQALESLDDDQKRYVQSMIDKAVSEKVQPVHDQFFRDKAQQTLDNAKREFGEDVWAASEQDILNVMQRDGIDARKAFLMIQGEKLLKMQKDNEQKEIQTKINVSSAPQRSSTHTIPAQPGGGRKIRSIRDAVHLAEEMYLNGDSRYDPTSYRVKAGQV